MNTPNINISSSTNITGFEDIQDIQIGDRVICRATGQIHIVERVADDKATNRPAKLKLEGDDTIHDVNDFCASMKELDPSPLTIDLGQEVQVIANLYNLAFETGDTRELEMVKLCDRDIAQKAWNTLSSDAKAWLTYAFKNPLDIEVVNIKTITKHDASILDDPSFEYIGRKISYRSYLLPDSPLANPFKVGANLPRSRACEKFCSEHLYPALDQKAGPIWNELNRLAERVQRGDKLRLGCWCEPQQCHGSDVRAAILELANKPVSEPVPKPVLAHAKTS